MADTNINYDNSSSSGSMEQLSTQIMVAAIVVLFMVIIFVLFLHLYARWFWNQRSAGVHTHPTPTRRRFVFAPPTQEDPILVLHRGLEPSLLRSLPVLIFHPDDFQDKIECAVCLCELQLGEKARLLPKCNHGFHVDCIDMWFQSHITCPLCRNIVSLVDNSSKQDESTIPAPHYSLPLEEGNSGDQGYSNSIESPNFPTNVLFWGNQALLVSTGSITPQTAAAAATEEDRPSSSSSSSSSSSISTTTSLPRNLQDGALVIEIPRLTTDGFSSLSPSPASRFPQEEMKSPMTTRLKSLRRLLGREKRVIIPSSPGFVDVEQGGGGNSHSSKTSSES
ncbi:Ring-h2 finger protein [Thalictrum thalictroides]|uniref:RING-type E3 ubiquitin transferase n=1 Tax=Thalictrum thalictroides TaxID=46969 RepID=A0A7J6VBJ5_THATH|nr:Ring-h2 finger protein [Thalictrum thalictroides]